MSEGAIPDTEYYRLRKELVEASHLHRRGAPMLATGGVKWMEMGLSPRDLDFLNGQQDAARQIHAAYGIHPVLTGLQEGTYENQKQAMRGMLIDAVLPFLDYLVEELNVWLTPLYGPNLRLEYDRDAFPALGEDQDSLWTRAVEGWSKGLLTRNEARALVDYDEVEDEERGNIFSNEIFRSSAGALPEDTSPEEDVPDEEPEDPEDVQDETAKRIKLVVPKDEFEKAMYWRSRVDLQERWERKVALVVKSVFEKDRKEINDLLEQVNDEGAFPENAVLEVLNDKDRWEPFQTTWIAALMAGAQDVKDRIENAQRPAQYQKDDPLALFRFLFGFIAEDVMDFVRNHFSRLVKDIDDRTRARITQLVERGARDGLSVPDIARSLDTLFLEEIIPNRTTVIARTETIRATNYGGQQAAKSTGLRLQKTWLATRDGRTRDAHVDADGQTVDIDGYYDVDGELLEYPGDPSGSPENTIQCRCTEFYSEVEE